MNFVKKIAAVLLLSATALSLVSCHGSRVEKVEEDYIVKHTSTFEVPDTFDTSKQYTISLWAKSDSNSDQTRTYLRAKEEFEKLYPNVTVNIKMYYDYKRIYSDVITNIQTGTTPNVCITYPDHIATYLEGEDIVVSLDGLIADEKYGLGGSELLFDGPARDEMVEKFFDECNLGGVQYGMPFMRSTEALYVNKTYVEALGFELPEDAVTWDFVWDVCEAAMEKNADGTYKVNGQDTLIPFIYKSTDNMMIQMLEQKGSPYSNADGDVQIFNDSTAEILYEVADKAERKLFSTFSISSYPGDWLNRGQCIFAVDSTAGASWMGTDAPNIDVDKEELVEFETAVLPIPQYDTENPKMISQGPSMCLFNKEDEGEVLASWLFMQYLLTDDIQISYASTEGYVPVTEKAQGSERYLDYLARAGEDDELYYDVKLAATRLMLDNTENTFVTPVFSNSMDLRNAAGEMIEEVTRSAKLKGEKVDSVYVNTLYEDVASMYHLDVMTGNFSTVAIALLVVISVTALGLAAYFIVDIIRKKGK